jgi:hypothetical protein
MYALYCLFAVAFLWLIYHCVRFVVSLLDSCDLFSDWAHGHAWSQTMCRPSRAIIHFVSVKYYVQVIMTAGNYDLLSRSCPTISFISWHTHTHTYEIKVWNEIIPFSGIDLLIIYFNWCLHKSSLVRMSPVILRLHLIRCRRASFVYIVTAQDRITVHLLASTLVCRTKNKPIQV